VEIKGWTLRNDPEDPNPNLNFPMQTINCHYQHHQTKRDLVLCYYSVNSNRYTTYATLFRGRSNNRYAGFAVKGTKMTEISNLEALEPALMGEGK
jgi:hypothetical protein